MSVALPDEKNSELQQYMDGLGLAARAAAAELVTAAPELKNAALLQIASVLDQRRDFVLAQNRKDLDAAADAKIGPAMLERLELNPARIDAMI